MGVFIGGAELGQPEPDLSALRSMVGRLPFESAMLHVAVLLCRLGPRLDDPPRQRELAKQFYASRPELLVAYERVLASQPATRHLLAATADASHATAHGTRPP